MVFESADSVVLESANPAAVGSADSAVAQRQRWASMAGEALLRPLWLLEDGWGCRAQACAFCCAEWRLEVLWLLLLVLDLIR